MVVVKMGSSTATSGTRRPLMQRMEYFFFFTVSFGLAALLARLADSGISCCIATASEAFQARSAMERLGLWPHFRFAVSCVQYGGKTRPDIYLEAARRLGTAPAETVVFEDALHAARTAHEAGFRVCGVWDASAEEDQAALKALADWYVRDLGDWVP